MPRRLRQNYLGPSPQRTLCLMSRPPKPPPDSLGNCYISMLPDELLSEIFAYLPPETDLYREPTYEECPPIPVICKHWENIYDATLYRKISFVEQFGVQKSRTSKAVENLQQQADLRNHVRDISVQQWHPSEATCRAIADTIKSCQAVRTVSLHLGWSTTAWPIIHAVAMLPRLEVLRLSGYDSGPSLQMILGHFNQPTLKAVQLSRYGLGSGDTPRAPWFPVEPSSQFETDKLSALARSHTSAMTSLELDDPSASPHSTRTLLKWPSRLVRLSLSQLINSSHGREYTLDALEPILNIHRESLQYIMVRIIPEKPNEDAPWTRSGIPNFSKFRCLHELHLSAYNLLAEKPSEAAVKLAAPLLRHLAMSFHTEDQHSESWTDFAADQALWMADFASQKATKETNTKLESVYVDFNPECDVWSVYEGQDMTWPWEHLQQAEQELSRCNITMKYSKPGCTKDEWDQIIVNLRKASEAEAGPKRIDDYLVPLVFEGPDMEI
ncbi:MAG: hypothetical protein ASARMPREDX12_001132 [Alectoria sarmentosa]|nr:MAG: hypothetical protein ASARMPREDX12_001132 [Alectoria sarmentosa]